MESEFFIRTLFDQLRRRRFPLGIEDYQTLRQALRAGFGWSSPQALRNLCCALWAKSLRERETLNALFDELSYELDIEWEFPAQKQLPSMSVAPESPEQTAETQVEQQPFMQTSEVEEPATQSYQGIPPISWAGVRFPERAFTFVPQFPLAYREIVQAWRRLRRPVREGAPTELNVSATLERRSRLGVPTQVVLMSPRRNRSRLLLLVDRKGSMEPFHRFIDDVCTAIQQSGRMEQVAIYYFHDVPAEGADENVLAPISHQLSPKLDTILSRIKPLSAGNIYADPEMLKARSLAEVLDEYVVGADVVIISDVGAARRQYDLLRLLDTLAFMKALRARTERFVWLNPLPENYWKNTTAFQIARHVPMFSLTRDGLYHAVNVLHGKPYFVERPF